MSNHEHSDSEPSHRVLSLKTIFAFWLPLSTTWLLMAFESPYINSVIARLPDAKSNLAAFGLAFSLALIIETPALMLLTTTTTLVHGPKSFFRLRNLMRSANLVTILGMLLVSYPSIFTYITTHIISVPPQVALLANNALYFLILWPTAVGFRRFYQGVMIKSGHTKLVAIGTVVRLLGTGGACAILYCFSKLPGAVLGALAIAIGVIGEAIFARIAAIPFIKNTLSAHHNDPELAWKRVLAVYLPLTLSILIIFCFNSIHAYFTSHGPLPIASLAVIPVVGGISFIISSLAFGMQETVIVLGSDRAENLHALRRFAFCLSALQFVILLTLSFTPLNHFVLSSLAGLKGELLNLGMDAFKLHLILPSTVTWLFWNRSLLLKKERAKFVTFGSILELVLLIIAMPTVMESLEICGALAVPITMTLTGAVQLLYFQVVRRRIGA